MDVFGFVRSSSYGIVKVGSSGSGFGAVRSRNGCGTETSSVDNSKAHPEGAWPTAMLLAESRLDVSKIGAEARSHAKRKLKHNSDEGG